MNVNGRVNFANRTGGRSAMRGGLGKTFLILQNWQDLDTDLTTTLNLAMEYTWRISFPQSRCSNNDILGDTA